MAIVENKNFKHLFFNNSTWNIEDNTKNLVIYSNYVLD